MDSRVVEREGYSESVAWIRWEREAPFSILGRKFNVDLPPISTDQRSAFGADRAIGPGS